MIKFVILDFDGTLCSTHAATRHCINLTFQFFTRPAPQRAETEIAIKRGVPIADVFIELAKGTILADEAALWAARYREIYNSGEGLAKTTLYEGVAAGLHAIAAQGCCMVILSNKARSSIDQALAHFRLSGYVTQVFGATEGLPVKPAAAAFEKVIRAQFPDVAARDVIVVGDTASDMRLANNIGAVACWARYGFGNAVECTALQPAYVADSFKQVCDCIAALNAVP